jgi:hypothetical protein
MISSETMCLVGFWSTRIYQKIITDLSSLINVLLLKHIQFSKQLIGNKYNT